MTKKPQTYPLRYVEDFLASPTKLQSNYRNAQQESFFHHPASAKLPEVSKSPHMPVAASETLEGVTVSLLDVTRARRANQDEA